MIDRRASVLWLVLALLAACGRSPPDPALALAASAAEESVPPKVEVEVEVAGCQSSRRTPPTCSLRRPTTLLNLWVGARQVPILEVDGAPAIARARPSSGDVGWTVEVEVPREARELTVHVGPGDPVWRLAFEQTPPTPTVDAIEDELAETPDDPRVLERALARLTATTEMSAYERIMGGRVRMLNYRDLGQIDRAIEVGHAALEQALDLGLAGEAIGLAQVLVYMHEEAGHTAAVELLLELQRLHLRLVADAGQRLRWHYYRGGAALELGDLRLALDELEAAESSARSLGLRADELAAASARAPLLGLVGRDAERSSTVDRILATTLERSSRQKCSAANDLNSAGWSIMLSRIHGTATEPAARLFDRALAYYTPSGGCVVAQHPDRLRDFVDVKINRALEAMLRQDWRAVEERLDAIGRDVPLPSQSAWIGYVRGELALARHQPQRALAALTGLVFGDEPLLGWQTAVLRGRALEQLGRTDDALAAFLDAERTLDNVIVGLGVDQGREGLIAGLHSSAGHVIRLHLAHKDVAAAAAAARRSRGRAVRPIGREARLARLSPTQRVEWTAALGRYEAASRTIEAELATLAALPQDEHDRVVRRHRQLRREMRDELDSAYSILGDGAVGELPRSVPATGELWLLYHPTEDGWIGFAIDQRKAAAVRLGAVATDASSTALSAALLEPFDAAIAEASTVRVLAMGTLMAVPFHTLPWRGQPLVIAKPVGYALDVGVTSAAADARAMSAVVISDPATTRTGLGALPSATREGIEVAMALREQQWNVVELAGKQAAHAAVIEAIGGADWLHFAGHATASGGWSSALPLAGEAELNVRDVLAMRAVPRAVLLSGCGTGAVGGGGNGQHLASAFVLAGARFVIATSEDLGDDDGLELSRALYGASTVDAATDGEALLRAALQRLAATDPSLRRWDRVRVWVP